MTLASTRFVNRAIRDARQPEHPRRLELAGAGGLDYDYVYVGGKRLTPPTKTTNFLKVYLDGVTACEWVAAMPETQDSDAAVFDVTKNRIQLAANFGGG